MLKIQLICLSLIFTASQLFAQTAPEPIYVAPDAPNWMHMMLAENPNVYEISDAYTAYYQSHPFEKSNYTQYYKRWMQWTRKYIQSDGSLHIPTIAEQEAFEQRLQALRTSVQERSTPSGNWTFIGPKETYDVNGTTKVTWQTNIYSVDIAESNPNIIYAGGEDGGAWRTTDKGLNWTPLTHQLVHGSITSIKADPTDAQIAYFGTSGKIVKTINGGSTWATVYSESGLTSYEIVIAAGSPSTIIAATNKGLLRSTDAGSTWTKIFTNVTWTAKYKPGSATTVWAIRDSGTSSQFVESTTGGASFTTKGTGWYTPGSGDDVTGAILAPCPSNPSKVYAYLCGASTNLAGYIGVFVSSDNGDTWINTNPAGAIGNSPTAYVVPSHTNLMASNGLTGLQQGFYDMAIVVNPANENQLIAGGTSWWKSTDGGATWTALGGYASGGLSWSHPDIQWLDAQGSDLWIASDGGLNYSNNFGGSIEARMNGISGSNMWGFDSGWNEDVLVGGRYHNGNMGYHEIWPNGKFYRLGGGEAATGYVNPGDARKTYFSDIGGKRLKGGFTDGVASFAVGLFPNESYAYYANSEMEWDPRCWNTLYLGNENKLWKSIDGGSSFEVLHTFPGTASNSVFEVEIARSNTSVMYATQFDGTDDRLWRSADAGLSWVKMTDLPTPNNNDRIKLAVSAENADILWVTVSYGSNGKKVYKSTNGGSTWINLTSAMLDGLAVGSIMAQYGTDGGIYVGTDGGVFYRNNTMTDWVNFSTNLPYSSEPNRLKPFYKTGKIRNGAWGNGVWDSDLYEASAIIPQAMASTLNSDCTRDTVFFDDHSVVNHTGATWSWAFSPAPTFVSSTTVRNPKVVFGSPGIYTATMTLNGTYTSTLQIAVNNLCEADTIPGKSVVLAGNANESAVALPALSLTTNTMTVTAWIKITGTQSDYASIFMHDGASAGFNFVPGNNHLGYHWDSGAWWWDSGLAVPTDQWTHVAMVVEPSGVTLYVNGVGAKNSFTVPTMVLNDIFRLGSYKDWGGRFVNGEIEEFCLFNSSLSRNQIRELMHLTKVPADQPNLLIYYQFNEPSGIVLDRVSNRHGSLIGNAVRQISTAPVGKGVSQRLTVSTTGVYDFTVPRAILDFPNTGTLPSGELCISRIDQNPNEAPGGLLPSNAYWVVHNYGTNQTFALLDGISLYGMQNYTPSASQTGYQLYKRSSYGEGPTWGLPIDQSETTSPNQGGTINWTTGNNITSFSQFFVNYISVLPVEWLEFSAKLVSDRTVSLHWEVEQSADVKDFTIESSLNGTDFQAIKTLAAHAGSGRKLYAATDVVSETDVVCYRIKQTDLGGKSQLSPIRSVQIGRDKAQWQVYPNPATAKGKLNILCAPETEYSFSLYDQSGKKVFSQRCTGRVELVMPDLPKGAYTYAIIGTNRRVSGVVIVD